MAARHPTHWLRALRPLRHPSSSRSMVRLQAFKTPSRSRPFSQTSTPLSETTTSSTTTAATTSKQPALLSSIKSNLKAAMRAKDAPRLTVLRSIITATNNAAKTPSPIATDAQLVSLLRRNLRASRDAALQAREAKRPDLAEAEEAQAGILEEYIAGSGIARLGEEEVKELVGRVVEGLSKVNAAATDRKVAMGDAMKEVKEALTDKDVEVDMKHISRLVKEAIAKL